MIKLFRLIVCALLVITFSSNSVKADRSNHHREGSSRDTYLSHLSTAIHNMKRRLHVLERAMPNYRRKIDQLCKTPSLADSCLSYKKRLEDSYSMVHLLKEKIMQAEEEALLAQEEVEDFDSIENEEDYLEGGIVDDLAADSFDLSQT